MNKIFFISLLLTMCASHPMDDSDCITIADAKTLNERLESNHLEHLAEKSELVDKLGGKKVVPTGVCLTVTCALSDYSKKYPENAFNIKERRHEILRLMLQEHPKAIAELQKVKLLEESKE